jgi:tRNA(Ile)-lysidine synthase TilS/MesJ
MHIKNLHKTLLLSLFYEGRISCFEPKTYLDRTEVTQIRPLLYIGEKSIENLAQKLHLPVVENTCPMDKNSKRQEVKDLVAELSQRYPDLKSKIFGAMQRLPLPQWGVEEPSRRPLPDVEV